MMESLIRGSFQSSRSMDGPLPWLTEGFKVFPPQGDIMNPRGHHKNQQDPSSQPQALGTSDSSWDFAGDLSLCKEPPQPPFMLEI